ncbi:GmrSD restriction endonuclease domain-containing protein [Helicobacter pylori]|uniref:GmrSD restriction endonuclease domain-containing protein n=1 Tax=Helicobacter pylori TaxID=210 RepID=UPI003562EC38
MKADATTLLGFFEENQNNQFVIPIYQRLYSWGKEQCKQLWDDIIKIGGNDKMNGHFIGSILYVLDGNTHSNNPLLIIDGQQRLTTITLLLIALRNRSSDEVKRKEIESYLINSDKDGDKKFRLILSESDKDTLLSLIDKDRRKPSEPSLKIVENFKLFEKWIRKNTDKLETIFKGLDKLMIVWIALKKGKDDPQLIFESMNSKGIELTQADLIRNYIITETEVEKQEDFYNQYWRAMEENFKQSEKQSKREDLFNKFVRHYLTIKIGKIPNEKRVYEAFKRYQQERGIETEILLQDLQKYCGYFCQIAFKKEADKDLNKALSFLVDLEMDVVYPLLLELYSDYKDGVLSKQDFIPIIYLTESYICRRAVCGIPSNGLNKFFPSFTKKIDKKQYLKSVEEHFGSLTGNQKFPNDFEFKDSFITKELYGRNKTKKKKTKYFLERLENFDTKEPVNTQECTIEHIIPQTLTPEWQRDLGENFKAIHEKYLHTIGNLTLTGYNEKYSNNSFQEKRDMEKGFKQSPLRLNQSLRDLEVFGEEQIKKRANDLADWALKIWTYPKLDAETLGKYKQKGKREKKAYDLSSYKFSSDSRELFDILREKIKAFDERITEKFMKHYITYKHDTIFASIAPLKSELNLNLKMDFSELQDEIKEKLKIRDVSNIGHLGIVSKKVKVVEVKLETKENIPYCLGLIKQALEKQMGGRNRQ